MSNSTFDIEALLSGFTDSQELANLIKLFNQGDLLEQSSPEIMQLALEYARLAAIPHPSEQEAERLGKILELANHLDILDFWIAEVDHIIGHHLDLLDEDARESYQDQQALVREYIGLMEDFPVPRNKQIPDYKCPNEPALYDAADLCPSCMISPSTNDRI